VVVRSTRPSVDERKASGQEARTRTPRSSHRNWRPADDRADPVALLEAQNAARDADLVPVRHGRMLASPFTFYRGSAKIMAADLARTPTAGLDVQLCGDAHLSNFGVFGSPERRLIFDLNDFDETLPGPFEYDVERLVASFVIAGRNNGFGKADTRECAETAVRTYREAMATFAGMRTMDIWYAALAEKEIAAEVRQALAEVQEAGRRGKKAKERAKTAERAVKVARRNTDKARTRDSIQALGKLAEVVDGRHRIVSQPPVVVPMRDLTDVYGVTPEAAEQTVRDQFRAYRATLRYDRRHLLERFQVVDVARKVVGVGSVGTRAFIVLLQGRDADDPLFLQVKEATSSVLEDHLPASRFKQHGERVVHGQRLMQAASDIYLGWAKGYDPNRHFYWRQLRDMKGSAIIEGMAPVTLAFYARLCGWTLARAHARSGDPIAIAGYLGGGDRFDKAITRFAERYADQNERDYDAFAAAVKSGRIEAVEGV
jgi:uncharacterized protein (DUF2252 family)